MTSKNSSHNAFTFTLKRMFKQCLPLGAAPGACMLLYCILIFVVNLIEYGSFPSYAHVNKNLMYCPSLFFETEIIYALLILFSCVFGLIAFNFLTNKKECNVYLALGIRKSGLFWSRYLGAGLALSITPVSVQAFTFLMNILTGETFMNSVNMKLWLFQTAYLLVTSLCAYSVTVLAFVNAGNVVEGIIFTFFYGVFPTLFTSVSEAAYGNLTYGSAYGTPAYWAGTQYCNKNWFLDIFASITEDTIIKNMNTSDVAANYVAPDPTGIIVCFIAFILIAVLASLMFKKRTSEISGTVFKSYNNYRILAVLLSVLAFCGLTGSNISSRYLLADLSIIIAVVIFIVVSLIFTRKVSAKTAISLAVAMAAFCVVCFVGYGKSVPETANIKSVYVATYPEEAIFDSNYDMTTSAKDSNLSFRKYSDGDPLFFTLTSKNDIEWIRDIHKDIVDDGYRSKLDDNSADGYIIISYNMKDGSKISRAYKYESIETYKKILGFMNTDKCKELNELLFGNKTAKSDEDEDMDYYYSSYNEKLMSIVSRYTSMPFVTADSVRSVLAENNNVFVGIYDNNNIFVGSKEINFLKDSSLRDALYKDLNSQTVEQKYFHSSSDEIGVITIESDEEQIARVYAAAAYFKTLEKPDESEDYDDRWDHAFYAIEPEIKEVYDEKIDDYVEVIDKDYVYPIDRESYKKNRTKAIKQYFSQGFVSDNYTYSGSSCRFVITKDMTNTVKWLKDNGLYNEKANADVKVVKARGYKYNAWSYDTVQNTTFVSQAINNKGFETTYAVDEEMNKNWFEGSGYITDEKTLKSLLENSRLCAANITDGFIVEFIFSDGTRAAKFVSKYNVGDEVESVFGYEGKVDKGIYYIEEGVIAESELPEILPDTVIPTTMG